MGQWGYVTLTVLVCTRVVQFVFWEQGFDEVCESSRTLDIFKGLMCNSGKPALGFFLPPSNLTKQVCMFVYK
jgi:hypothetical protein